MPLYKVVCTSCPSRHACFRLKEALMILKLTSVETENQNGKTLYLKILADLLDSKWYFPRNINHCSFNNPKKNIDQHFSKISDHLNQLIA